MDQETLSRIALWIVTAVVWALSAWTIVAAIVEVARGKSRLWHQDVIAALLFHGGTAVLVLWLANFTRHGF